PAEYYPIAYGKFLCQAFSSSTTPHRRPGAYHRYPRLPSTKEYLCCGNTASRVIQGLWPSLRVRQASSWGLLLRLVPHDGCCSDNKGSLLVLNSPLFDGHGLPSLLR